MTHLPYILGAYGLAAICGLWLSIDAVTRTAKARRRLTAIDPRTGTAQT